MVARQPSGRCILRWWKLAQPCAATPAANLGTTSAHTFQMNPLSTRPNRWRPITVFNLLVGLLFSLSALAQPAFLTNGLVAYYPFNGNANDESGFSNNGTAYNATLTSDRFGTIGVAYSFDGLTSYIQTKSLGDSAPTNESTISVWVYNLSNPSLYAFVVGQEIQGGSGVLQLKLNTSGTMDWYTRWGWAREYVITPQGRWTHYIATSAKGDNRIYVNGVISATNNSMWNDQYRSGEIFMGRSPFFQGPTHGYMFFKGMLDDIRIYNRAFSDGEVKVLYDYESTPQTLNPRIATVTAQVVNGFVVGTTITDAGYGYASNPVVAIIGGGGTGAKATATQFNGVVTSITITNPGSGYTSTPTITIAPPPFPPKKATATSQVVNGFVVGTKITDGGFGYESPPAVLFIGGGGSGATAVATIENGVVTAINITNPGTGYTSAPHIRIASPPFSPKLSIDVTRVRVSLEVVLGRKYQIESSADLQVWLKAGDAFIAQDEVLQQDFDVNISGRYFRINQVP